MDAVEVNRQLEERIEVQNRIINELRQELAEQNKEITELLARPAKQLASDQKREPGESDEE